jgi:hypothetical protein
VIRDPRLDAWRAYLLYQLERAEANLADAIVMDEQFEGEADPVGRGLAQRRRDEAAAALENYDRRTAP